MKSSLNKKEAVERTPEVRSALVRVAHKLSSRRSNSQVVKIGEKYFRIKELG